MKQFIFCLLILFMNIYSTIYADNFTDDSNEEIVIESFDGEGLTINGATGNPVIWKVFGSKFSTDGYPMMKYVNAFPEELFGKDTENTNGLNSIAISGSYTRKGYNSLELISGEGKGNKWHSEPLLLPGIVDSIDLWFWGSNFDYSLELYISDFQGIVQIIEMGSVKHIGWKHLFVKIPRYMKRTDQYLRSLEGMKLIKLVVRTDPRERVDLFYLYIDQFKILSDTHLNNLDSGD